MTIVPAPQQLAKSLGLTIESYNTLARRCKIIWGRVGCPTCIWMIKLISVKPGKRPSNTEMDLQVNIGCGDSMVSTEAFYGGSFPCVILKGKSSIGLVHGKYW